MSNNIVFKYYATDFVIIKKMTLLYEVSFIFNLTNQYQCTWNENTALTIATPLKHRKNFHRLEFAIPASIRFPVLQVSISAPGGSQLAFIFIVGFEKKLSEANENSQSTRRTFAFLQTLDQWHLFLIKKLFRWALQENTCCPRTKM